MAPKANAKVPAATKQATLRSFFELPKNMKPAKPEQTTLKRGKPESVVKNELEADVELERGEEGDVVMADETTAHAADGENEAQQEVVDEIRNEAESRNVSGQGENKKKRRRSTQDDEREKGARKMEGDAEKEEPAPKKREVAKAKKKSARKGDEKGNGPDAEPATKLAAVEKKMREATIKKEKSPSEEEEEEEDAMPIKKKGRKQKAIKVIKEDGDAESGEEPPEGEAPKTSNKGSSAKKSSTITKKEKVEPIAKSSKKAAATREAKKEVEEDEASPESETEVGASEAEEVKPSLSASAQKELRMELVRDEPAYPDWPSGESTPYAAICKTFSLLEDTSQRLKKLKYVSSLLRQVLRLNPDELLLVVHILTNKLAADFEGIELGIGESTLMKAIADSCGRSVEKLKADHREIGDLGAVAAASRQSQSTLTFKGTRSKPLTVASVHEQLLQIATTTGGGTVQRKIDIIKKLLASAGKQGDEAKYIVRALEGKMRLGAAGQTSIQGLSQAVVFWEKEKIGKTPTTEELQEGEATLKAVFSQCPSYEVIIPEILKHGMCKLKETVKLQPGIPLKPMLAKASKSIGEAVDSMGSGAFTMEYKYDGERTQIHYVSPNSKVEYANAKIAMKQEEKGLARIFSRNSEELSGKYPDILAGINTWIKPEVESFVLDCEAVGWDENEMKLLPFQTLMTRKRKGVAIEDVKVKAAIFAFDLLFLNGKSLVKEPFTERRRLLHQSFTPVGWQFNFVTAKDTSSAEDVEPIQTFLDESIKASCEGLMVKALTGTNSVYEPAARSRFWVKIKKDYLSGVGDSLDLVVLGAYHGKGKRTSVYGAFLLGCYNPSKQAYETMCNIGTGFSEQILEELHDKLVDHVIDRPKPYYAFSKTSENNAPDVWFEPAMVWEVKTADLTISPKYKAAEGLVADNGISLRFPRFLRIREDKKPEEATTSRQVAEMYRNQEVVNGNGGKKSVDDDYEY